jgi:hypothetical protein
MRSAFVVLALAACSPQLQTVQLVNKTARPIEQVFVYPIGSPDHGPSRMALAPNASQSLQLAPGNLEVMAVSAKITIDEHTRDRPMVTGGLELHGPMQVIFYDADAKPPEVDRPGVIGVPFKVRASNAPQDQAPLQ